MTLITDRPGADYSAPFIHVIPSNSRWKFSQTEPVGKLYDLDSPGKSSPIALAGPSINEVDLGRNLRTFPLQLTLNQRVLLQRELLRYA